ncbi:uncharacterized protein [Periplaneta americana]|uniref:uncharacterized protein n=1 Tax=Periplaneta americana TaxID=6978 RepID=UPI0037E79209
MLSNRKVRKPELEEMRKKGRAEGTAEAPDLTELLEKTSRLHAALLFDKLTGLKALQKLCRCLNSSKSTYGIGDWQDFGIRLGVDPFIIKSISNNAYKEGGPTYYTLLAFVQQSDATLNKILIVLEDMGRLDVISMTFDHLSDLADEILGSYMNNDDSDYFSISDGNVDSENGAESLNRNIIGPLFKPAAPFEFREIIHKTIISQQYGRMQSPCIEEESNQNAVAIIKNSNHKNSKSHNKVTYGRKVLLTFASDGLHTAQQVAAVFRKTREDLPRIGVVILNEHFDTVNSNPEEFIFCCFHQVDYVVPIITEEYLRAISFNDVATGSSMMCMDTKYIQFIFNLMSTYYLRNGCINDKIRCVVPDRLVYLTQRHPIMSRPQFQAWVKESETEELSRRILRSRF